MYVNENECKVAGLNIKKVESIARRIENAVKEASDLGMILFGGSGNGSLRYEDNPDKGRLIVAELAGNNFDGGDGGNGYWGDDLERGE